MTTRVLKVSGLMRIEILNFILLFLYLLMSRGGESKVIFLPVPIKGNQYWCEALRELNIDAVTFMSGFYASIHKKSDFDIYY